MKRHIRVMVSYARERVGILACLAVCTVIFAVVFKLYRIPYAASGYGGLLCLFFLLLCSIADFYRYNKKHTMLQRKQGSISISMDNMPESPALIERDYAALLQILYKDKLIITEEYENSKKQMRDYYDIWTHQIKIPISAINLVIDDDYEPETKNEILKNELHKIERYVEMALYYTKLDGIDTDYIIKKQSIDIIIRKAIRKYARYFIQKKIKLEYSGTDLEAVTDEKWLGFIIEQLLSNSAKYTPEGGRVSVYAGHKEGGRILVIKDTGIGIPPQDIPRIFEKGYTGVNGHENHSSTGIGLYLSQRIAYNLNISIKAYSLPDKGAEFVLVFP